MRLLHKPDPPDREYVLDNIREWSEDASNDIDDLVGFVVIAWGRDGTYTIHDFFGEGSPVSRSLGPHFVTECMRRRNAVIDTE